MPNHFLPHRATFEGYYTRIDLATGATLILVLCHVRKCHANACLTYISPAGAVSQCDVFADADADADSVIRCTSDGAAGFSLALRAIGTDAALLYAPHAGVQLTFRHAAADGTRTDMMANISPDRTPWSLRDPRSGPEGYLAWLPLPLHWYVHALSAQCRVRFAMQPAGEQGEVESLRESNGTAHLEKNWSQAFPRSHIWMQARSACSKRGICLAGGNILGLTAFLIGYRDEERGLDITFRPPFTLWPFLRLKRNWDKRSVEICVTSLMWKAHVQASARAESFFTLAAPWEAGFRKDWMAQSVGADVNVKFWKRPWWLIGKWRLMGDEQFERSGLEFGGEFFPWRGKGLK